MVQATKREERMVQAGKAAGVVASDGQEGGMEDRGIGSWDVLTAAMNQGRPTW